MTISSLHSVPKSVVNVAKNALATHSNHPLDEQVGGVTLAKKLAAGEVDTVILEKMRRFFSSQSKPYSEHLQQQHTSQTNALVRTWDMYGGDSGKAWSERELTGAVKEGYEKQDMIVELLKKEPDDVYDAFSVGAWRWEYDLTPQTAATFCEEYQRATGFILDLGKAFGASSGTIGKAIHRKYNAPNSFEIAMKALKIDDTELQLSATVDLEDFKTLSTKGLSESLKQGMWRQGSQIQGRILWQVLIAHLILAVEAPHLLTAEAGFDRKKKPQLLFNDKGKFSPLHYSDAQNIFDLYFQEWGARFNEILHTDTYQPLVNTLWDGLYRAWFGKPILGNFRIKIFKLLRKYVKETKLASAAFHTILTSWNKGDWLAILDMLPPDADITPQFQKFVRDNPLPKDGVKLQQVLLKKEYLDAVTASLLDVPGHIEKVKINSTPLRAVQPPVGVYSVVDWKSKKYVVLGVFDIIHDEGGHPIPLKVALAPLQGENKMDLSAIGSLTIGVMASEINTEKMSVLAAHYQLKGSGYANAHSAQEKHEKNEPVTAEINKSEEEPDADKVSKPELDGTPAPTTADQSDLASDQEELGQELEHGDVVKKKDGTYWLVISGDVVNSSSVHEGSIMLRSLGVPNLIDYQKSLGTGWEIGYRNVFDYSDFNFSDLISNLTYQSVKATNPDADLVWAKGTEDAEKRKSLGLLEVPDIISSDFLTKASDLWNPQFWLPSTDPLHKPNTYSLYVTASKDACEKGEPPMRRLGQYEVGEAVVQDSSYAPEGDTPNPLQKKLGYSIDWAREFSVEVELLKMDEEYLKSAVPAPHNAPFPVGTKVLEYANGYPKSIAEYRLVLWKRHHKAKGKVVAVFHTRTEGIQSVVQYTPSSLLKSLKTLVEWADDEETIPSNHFELEVMKSGASSEAPGTTTFSKFGGADKDLEWGYQNAEGEWNFIRQSDKGSPPGIFGIDPDNPIGPEDVFPIKAPPTVSADTDHHLGLSVSAGVIMVTSYPLFTPPRLVLFHPSGEYGGYKTAIPKGRVGKDESMELAACREVFEETGLVPEIKAFLGDFKSGSDLYPSITRLYIGVIKKGHPTLAGEESEGIVIAEPDKLLESKGNLIGEFGNTWQITAINAAKNWVEKNGNPANAIPDIGDTFNRVTFDDDILVPGKATPAPAFSGKNADQYTALSSTAKVPFSPRIVSHIEWAMTKLFGDSKVRIEAQRAESNFGRECYVKWETNPSDIEWWNTERMEYSSFVNALQSGANRIEDVADVEAVLVGKMSVEVDDGEETTFRQFEVLLFDLLGENKPGLVDVTEKDDRIVWAGSPSSRTPIVKHPDPVLQTRLAEVAEGVKDQPDFYEFKKLLKETDFPSLWMPLVTASNMRYASMLCSTSLTSSQIILIDDYFQGQLSLARASKPPPQKPESGSVGVIPPVNVEHPLIVSTMHNLDPIEGEIHFKDTDESMPGGSKPNRILEGPGGRYLFKSGHHEDPKAEHIAQIEGAVYRLSEIVKPNNIPVGVMMFEGRMGSLQPIAEPNEPPPSNPDVLSDINKVELLSQHAVDMFIGDHDGHAGNFLMVGGKLRAVDKGQSFRLLLERADESLDPSFYDPDRNFNGLSYAKKLLLSWAKDEATIPAMAFVAMHNTILNIKGLADWNFTFTLHEAFSGIVGPHQAGVAMETLKRRAERYEADWLTVLKKLKSDFKWVGGGTGVSILEPLQDSEEEMGFGLEQDRLISQAIGAGGMGTTLSMDTMYIESQQVVVREVIWKDEPSTFIQFKMTQQGGKIMGDFLTPLSSSSVLVGSKQEKGMPHMASEGTPARLPMDLQEQYHEKILAAHTHLKYHLEDEKDGKENIKGELIDPAISLSKPLQRLEFDSLGYLEANPDDKSVLYHPGDGTTTAYDVNRMATWYLSQIEIIRIMFEKPDDYSSTPPTPPYLSQSNVYKETKTSEEQPNFKSTLSHQNAVFPTLVSGLSPNAPLIVKNLKSIRYSGLSKQYHIRGKGKAQLFLIPPDTKIQGNAGHCWGIVNLPPSNKSVALLSHLFTKATNLPMKPSSEMDKEFMYWWQQAHPLQSGGIVKPSAAGDSTTDSKLKDIRAMYRSGDVATAVQELKRYIAKSTTKTMEWLTSSAEVERQVTVHGRPTQKRLGWDTPKLESKVGSGKVFAHRTPQMSISKTLRDMSATAPVLLSAEERTFHGVDINVGNTSLAGDFSGGGSQSVFACIRPNNMRVSGHFLLHISLGLRLDVYQVGTHDTYGDWKHPKRMNPGTWTTDGEGSVDATSSGQINIRYGVDLLEYLVGATCFSEDDRNECVDICENNGWKFKHGTPQDIFRLPLGYMSND